MAVHPDPLTRTKGREGPGPFLALRPRVLCGGRAPIAIATTQRARTQESAWVLPLSRGSLTGDQPGRNQGGVACAHMPNIYQYMHGGRVTGSGTSKSCEIKGQLLCVCVLKLLGPRSALITGPRGSQPGPLPRSHRADPRRRRPHTPYLNSSPQPPTCTPPEPWPRLPTPPARAPV